MEEHVKQFIKIRNYLNSQIQNCVETYICGGEWDPLYKHILIRETKKVIMNELKYKFPQYPSEHLPKCKIKIDETEKQIEAGIQTYFNSDTKTEFLGSIEFEDTLFDMYVKKSLDPTFNYTFIARYGHYDSSKFEGGRIAASEYLLEKTTPLSIAYKLAVEDGFII
jgi:hypothetical protein